MLLCTKHDGVHLPVQVFGQVAAQITCPMQARLMVANTLVQLQSRYPEQMGPLLAQLPAEQQTSIQQLVASSNHS